uniref:Integrin beta n=1 Tax=Esox lucius TaxID=8010 RepID=A0A3P8Z4N8_ESOLU
TKMTCVFVCIQVYDGPRCDLKQVIVMRGCKNTMTATGSVSILEVSITLTQPCQVSPQKVTMSLLPGEERVIDMEVYEPVKGPLDLYILMDFSNSMQDDLDNLKKMGTQLDLSDDFTIGFGKFVDKVVEPQTDMRPSKLAKPWPNSDPPFSFQHVITLTSDERTFTEKLTKERISGNLDAPEGGFDAILQTAVCGDKIGWRNDSTHLLVFSTESAFHYEADGANVLSGILPRNDEQCHLDTQGKYTMDTKQDYPSVPTLVRLLGNHNIIPIFAVTKYSYSYYEKLQEYFPIAELGILQEDSTNFIALLRSAFASIRSKMSIRAQNPISAIQAEVQSEVASTAQAGYFEIKPGNIGRFKVRVKANEKAGEGHVCELKKSDRNGEISVKPTTFSADLKINAEVLCQTCKCEQERMKNAPKCSGNGDLVCGTCQCAPGWMGPFCNCSAKLSSNTESTCLGPNMAKPCSDRGQCLCGTCVCDQPDQYEGPYCQFHKLQCPRHRGFLCYDHGSCSMGQCVCAHGWKGQACECPLSNQTCLDTKGGLCNNIGECECGRCKCPDKGLPMTSTCERNVQAQRGMCDGMRSCVQCQAWKTGEKKAKDKCDTCPFKVIMVDKLKENEDVFETCVYRDEDDDCTYQFTVDYSDKQTEKNLEVQGLKKKECPPGSFLWLIPLIMFLMLLLGLLLLCCWKYCACCKVLSGRRMVGFKEDQYMLRQSLLTSDHLDTPLVRTGPPKSTDVVRWKITDNVHRPPSHPLAQVQPDPKQIIPFPLSLRLVRLFSDNLSRCDPVRLQRNAGKRKDHTIVDTVLHAPRSSYPDIVQLTEKNVQSGNFQDVKVMPNYYTVATDREATGAVEFQEGVEMVDVRVPLFIKDEDDDEKRLLLKAVDVPLGIAEIGKRFVNITIIKEHAKSVLTFLQPAYTYSRQDKVANIPISREIIEDGNTQVTYRTRDLTAKDKKDYVAVDGVLPYGPGETQKNVPVSLLELGKGDSLLDTQVKQFVMDLSNPKQGAKLGRYPRTTVTITDQPGEMLQTTDTLTDQPGDTLDSTDNNSNQPDYTVWAVREEPDARHDASLKLLSLSPIPLGRPEVAQMQSKGFSHPVASPGGRLLSPTNVKATATGPRNIRLNWDSLGNSLGYKVKYWIYGDPEADAQVMDVKTTQAELTKLYPYCDYEMKVCGYNALGDGNYSEMVPCQTLEDVPSEPGRLAFNVISPTVTQVSWAEPAEPNGVITAYEVIYTPINEDNKQMGVSKKVKIDNPKKRMLLIENLQSAQTYFYQVRAKNSVGWGPFKDATINLASQPTRPMSIPIIPDIPIVDAEAGEDYDSYLMYSSEVLKSPTGSKRPSVSDEEQVNGRWEQNFLFPGGGGSMSRSANMSSSSYGQASPMSTLSSNHRGGGGGSMTMDSTTTYISGQGNIADSLSKYSRPSPGVPDTPTRLVFSALGPTALKVSWQEPHCERDVLGYCVLYQLLNGGDVKRINVSSPAENSVVVQDLLPNHSYLFKVKAQSQEGWGPEREGVITIESAVDPNSPLSPMPGSPFTLSTPSAPGPLVFTALSPEALQLSWDKPRKPNGDILGYVVTCEQLHGGGDMRTFQVSGDSAETSLTVPNLRENMPYKFKVQAKTTQGFGPEREGIITIESQEGGKMTNREVFQLPTDVTTHTNVTHTMVNDPYFSDGMMMTGMTTQHIETGGMVTRHVTKEVVQRSMQMAGTSSVTKKVERSFYET